MMIGTRRAILNNRFNPLSISGLSIWLDAQDSKTISLSGGNVVQWNDKSGKGNHAVQGTGVNQPVLVASGINGKPAIRGFPSGVLSQMTIADSPTLKYSEFTAFVVFAANGFNDAASNPVFGKYEVTGAQREFMSILTPTTHLLGQYLSSNGTSNTLLQTPNAFVVGSAKIGVVGFADAAQNIQIFGEEQRILAGSVVFNGTGAYFLFSRTGSADYFNGWIGEHLFFNRALSGVEIANINNYLSKKWGVV